jgi:glycosyltransferase involved in cell wall biosynthesis
VKILVLSTALHGGGAEYVARTWATGLAQRGHDVVVATTSAERRPATSRNLEHVPLTGNNFALKVRSLRSLYQKRQFDAVLSLQTFPNLVAIAASLSLPPHKRPRVFVSERNLVSLGMPGSTASHRAKIHLARRLYRRAHGAIAISHPVAAELVSWFGVPGERCVVVPNPATAKVSGIEQPIMRPLDLGREVSIVMPARQVAQKQPWLAIRAAKELQNRGHSVSVISFGSGPLSEATAALARELDVKYRAAGWVENWCAELPANSVVVLSSLREGFGNVLVECAAVGVPSVALSSALGVADAIVPGVTGSLALTSAPADLADAVLECGNLEPLNISGWLSRFSPLNSLSSLEKILRASL